MRVRQCVLRLPAPFVAVCFASLLVASSATGAAAQSPYVGGAVLADIVRSSGTLDQQPGNAETFGAAFTSLGEKWGVELEFVRSGETEWRPDFGILAALTPSVPSFINTLPNIALYPSPQIEVDSQLSTFTTSVWFRQTLGDRFSLVYLGGAAFARTEIETDIDYPVIPLPRAGQTVPTRLYSEESVIYDAGLSVGLNGDIEMTDHLRLVPGIRLLNIASQWLLRPSVGLHWRF
jgi:hypothetical protein